MNESDCAPVSFNIFYDTFNRHGPGGACKTRNTKGAEHGDVRGVRARPHIRFPSVRANPCWREQSYHEVARRGATEGNHHPFGLLVDFCFHDSLRKARTTLPGTITSTVPPLYRKRLILSRHINLAAQALLLRDLVLGLQAAFL